MMVHRCTLILLCLCATLAQAQALDGEFITEWLLLGPFPSKDLDRDFLASAGGEAHLHPQEGHHVIAAPGDTLRWRRHQSMASIIDLDHVFGALDSVTIYAFCILQSAAKARVKILLGSDDGVAVWINGKQVHRHAASRPVRVDEDVFEADLEAGENRCLVKVVQGVRDWGLAMRAFPADRPAAVVPKVGVWADRLKIYDNTIWLLENWLYRSGDNLAWTTPEFDDRGWELTNTWFPLRDPPHSGWTGIGWFRLHVAVDSTLWNQTLALNVKHWGASEIYLDGALFARFGKVGSSKHDEEGYWTPDDDGIPPPQPILFDKKAHHVIAVRFSNFSTEKYRHVSQGFELSLIDLDRAMTLTSERIDSKRKSTIHQMLLTGIVLAFSLLHLLLFLFYPRARANLYYAAFTASFGLTICLWFQTRFVTTPVDYAWVYRLFAVGFAFVPLFFVRLVYWLMYPKLPKKFFAFAAAGVGIILWVWLTLSFTAVRALFMLVIAAFAECVRVWVVAMVKRRQTRDEGSWIIFLGMIPFALVVVYYSLGALYDLPLPWGFEDFPTPFYAILLLMISMSVFLSRNFAQTNKNLETQLVQVKALTEKTVQQEREKAQLEAENTRKTRELEQARKVQLSMLPKIVPQLPDLEIAVHMQTAAEVGGDYYDFKVHDDGSLTVAIGDATGHGLHAGTMVAATKSLFNSLADEAEPLHILQKATKALKGMGFRDLYMALTVAKFERGRIRIAAAGMPCPLVHRSATAVIEEVALKGMPLGSFPNFSYQQQELNLDSGDTVLFMSDGFPEMFNRQGKTLGEELAKASFAEAAQEPPEQIVAHLINTGKAWAEGRAPEDDVTFLVMRIH